jgi:hypothetical protein
MKQSLLEPARPSRWSVALAFALILLVGILIGHCVGVG